MKFSLPMPHLPLPIIPELVSQHGVDEAMMLAVLMEIVGGWQGHVTIDEQRLYSRVKYLPCQQQRALLASLVVQDLVEIVPQGSGLLAIHLMLVASDEQEKQPTGVVSSATGLRQKSVAKQSSKKLSVVPFGSSGRGRDDELSRIFAAKEAEIARQVAMNAQWQPSENTLALLAQNMNISEAFALGLRDEFIVYYMDKGRRESLGGWDQKFLKWVKREHVQQLSASARAQQQANNQNDHEEARYLVKEKRRQLTEAVLDIRNTDW